MRKGLISLKDAAKRLGISKRDRARPDRYARAMLQRMEQRTGLVILLSTGEGKGIRHVVVERAMEAVLAGQMERSGKKMVMKRAPLTAPS